MVGELLSPRCGAEGKWQVTRNGFQRGQGSGTGCILFGIRFGWALKFSAYRVKGCGHGHQKAAYWVLSERTNLAKFMFPTVPLSPWYELYVILKHCISKLKIGNILDTF